MKQRLVKQFENGTDFSVCVIQLENGIYAVTEYDFVNKKHELKGKYKDEAEAIVAAKEINRSFMNENKRSVRLKESQLRDIVKETIKNVLKEGLHKRYVFHCYIPGEGNHVMAIDNIEDVKGYISRAGYWDVSTGDNTSEPENLVAWGGKDGYWYNVINKPAWANDNNWRKPSEDTIRLILSKKQD